MTGKQDKTALFSAALQRSSDEFQNKLSVAHDDLGLVLKCHLITEDALSRYLQDAKGLANIDKARLSFSQKAELIDSSDGLIFSKKGALKQLNKVRNKFGHNFAMELTIDDMGEIGAHIGVYLVGVEKAHKDVMKALRESDASKETIDAMEALLKEQLTDTSSTDASRESFGLLVERNPQAVLKSFSRSFCDAVTMEIYRSDQPTSPKES